MSKTALITGATSGLGYQLVLMLLDRFPSWRVYTVGRNFKVLNDAIAGKPHNLISITADLATEEGRFSVVKAVSHEETIDYLIHCAAQVSPIDSITRLDIDRWRQAQAINVEAPLFLTLSLESQLKCSRVLFITSDSLIEPIAGMSSYCVSKGALQMIWKSLRLELSTERAVIALVAPGNIDTPMQAQLRRADPEVLPMAPLFKQLLNDNRLLPAEVSAQFLVWLLIEVSQTDLDKKIWNIYEEMEAHRWIYNQ